MFDFIPYLPLWQAIRLLGIVSFIMLAAGICVGILYSFPFWSGKSKANVYKLHTSLTIGGTAVGLLHGIITVIDTYMPFSWSEVLIPFTAHNHPILNGLGTLSAYGLLILIFSSDIRNKLKKKVWFLIHLLSYPIFIMAFIHGFFLGSDTAQTGVRWIYFLSAVAVISLTLLRGFVRGRGPKVKIITPTRNGRRTAP
jgi:methionine sulfoxide reductase heme-binding subunit